MWKYNDGVSRATGKNYYYSSGPAERPDARASRDHFPREESESESEQIPRCPEVVHRLHRSGYDLWFDGLEGELVSCAKW